MIVNVNQTARDLLRKNHILIGGTTGSGKSSLLQLLVYTALSENPAPHLILIDPKRTGLKMFRYCAPVLKYCNDNDEVESILDTVINIMVERYKELDADIFAENSNRPPLYVFIDEYADLLSMDKKQAQRIEQKIKRIGNLGRACNVHLIIATQTILANIVTTEIKNNMTLIALPCIESQSRVILGNTMGTEITTGQMVVKAGREIMIKSFPKIPLQDLKTLINYWNK